MIEKFNTNTKGEKFTNLLGIAIRLIVIDPSSSDRKATATNQMDSNDLEACGKKCCYFWFNSEVKFLTRF